MRLPCRACPGPRSEQRQAQVRGHTTDRGPDPTACGLGFLAHRSYARDAGSRGVPEAGDATLETAGATPVLGDLAHVASNG